MVYSGRSLQDSPGDMMLLILKFKAIAVAGTIDDVFSEIAEFFTQSGDVYIDGSFQYITVIIPDFAQKILSGEYASRRLCHCTEYFEFFFRQQYGFSV